MAKRFLLFGEKPFEVYAREKFSLIASAIERMSDVETLMYKDSFEELVRKTVNSYSFPSLNISFENKVVDLVGKPYHKYTRYFAEYSVIVDGDPYFLGLSPYSSGYRSVNLMVEVKENVMSFEIDTQYFNEELTRSVTAQVKWEYDRIKKFITSTTQNLNETIAHYNRELEKFVIPHLADKLRKAERCWKIKESLNFK
jgi:hypothetical protein